MTPPHLSDDGPEMFASLQRIAMTLTRMHATGTRLPAATMPSYTAPIMLARRLPICLTVGAERTAARCCTTLPKLRCVRNKQEVYVHGYQSRGRHESASQSQCRGSRGRRAGTTEGGGQQAGLRLHVRLNRIRPALLGAGGPRENRKRTPKRLFGG